MGRLVFYVAHLWQDGLRQLIYQRASLLRGWLRKEEKEQVNYGEAGSLLGGEKAFLSFIY
jgi:hypothetical protein